MKIPKKITSLLAEETGWHIGDGSMNFYNHVDGNKRGLYQLRGYHTDDKQHYIERIKPIFKELYDYNVSLRDMPSTRVFGFQIWNNKLVKFKQSLGLPLGKKLSIKIPEIFLKTNELKASVLRGIFDTDGCIYLEPKYGKLYPIIQISTISKNLANQLKKEFLSLELRATYYHQKEKNLKGNRKIVYTITIRGNEMLHCFMKIINPKNKKFTKKYNFYCSKIL